MGICWLLISASSEELSGLPVLEETVKYKEASPEVEKEAWQHSVQKLERTSEEQWCKTGELKRKEVNNLPLLLQDLNLKYNCFKNCLDEIFELLPASNGQEWFWSGIRMHLVCASGMKPGACKGQISKFKLPHPNTQQGASARKLHKRLKWETYTYKNLKQ